MLISQRLNLLQSKKHQISTKLQPSVIHTGFRLPARIQYKLLPDSLQMPSFHGFTLNTDKPTRLIVKHHSRNTVKTLKLPIMQAPGQLSTPLHTPAKKYSAGHYPGSTFGNGHG
jgi:hypothetical protein